MNKCGDCNVCCEVLSIKGFKEAGVKCEKLCGDGCSIYSKRPDACKHFKCVWLASGWPEEFRPDKSGIMLAGFKDQISAYRIKDNINKNLFSFILKTSSKNKKVVGYDYRNL